MAPNTPFLSIVVPTYRRPDRLAACLRALAQLEYPRDRFEVVVVDDGSDAPPDQEVDAVRSAIEVTLLRAEHGGPAMARNAGAARAKGEFLCFTDDDCAPAPGWLSAFAASFRSSPEAMLGGQTVNALTDNVYSATSQLLVDYLCGYYNADPSDARFFTSNNVAMSADRFREIGGFDTSFPLPAAEDREICDRWRRHGRPLRYTPDAVVYHSHPLTLRSFWRQHFNYGRGAFHLHVLRARQQQDRIRLEPPSFYLNLLAAAVRSHPGRVAPAMTVLMAISQAANAAGFFNERRRSS
jgi:GT2 family glycosyltransferase